MVLVGGRGRRVGVGVGVGAGVRTRVGDVQTDDGGGGFLRLGGGREDGKTAADEASAARGVVCVASVGFWQTMAQPMVCSGICMYMRM